MTAKTAIVRARVRPDIKAAAQNVLDKLGLTISETINLLLVQIKMKKAGKAIGNALQYRW